MGFLLRAVSTFIFSKSASLPVGLSKIISLKVSQSVKKRNKSYPVFCDSYWDGSVSAATVWLFLLHSQATKIREHRIWHEFWQEFAHFINWEVISGYQWRVLFVGHNGCHSASFTCSPEYTTTRRCGLCKQIYEVAINIRKGGEFMEGRALDLRTRAKKGTIITFWPVGEPAFGICQLSLKRALTFNRGIHFRQKYEGCNERIFRQLNINSSTSMSHLVGTIGVRKINFFL